MPQTIEIGMALGSKKLLKLNPLVDANCSFVKPISETDRNRAFTKPNAAKIAQATKIILKLPCRLMNMLKKGPTAIPSVLDNMKYPRPSPVLSLGMIFATIVTAAVLAIPNPAP